MADEKQKRAPKKPRELTDKQEIFCQEYIISLNATEAAKKAGYSGDSAYSIGSENLRKPEVKARIAELQKARARARRLNQDYVVNRLVDNAERSLQAEPVTDKDGQSIGVYRYDGSTANRSLELLGKHLGMFGDKMALDITGEIGVTHSYDFSKLTTDELNMLYALLAKASTTPGDPEGASAA